MRKSASKKLYIYMAIVTLAINIISLSVHADNNQNSKEHCLISMKTLKKPKKLNNLLFIDVRSNHIFNKKHIPNSINVPLQLTDTKAFLKNKNVVLVGNGWNEPLLIEKCIQLKIKGFKSVKVLSGGIISWFKSQKKLSKRALVSLTSKDFFNNKFEKKFVPYVISDKNKSLIRASLPHAKVISLKATKKQLLDRFKHLGKGINPIVIFSDVSPVIDAAINDYLHKPKRKMYYFEGGFNAYKQVDELNKMTSVSNQHKRLSTKKPISCAN